jgi:hypothetical protein
MDRLIIHSRVDADGVLRIAVPVGKEDADREMLVTIEPTPPADSPAQEDYRAWLDSIAGQWRGEFERLPVAEFETRDTL